MRTFSIFCVFLFFVSFVFGQTTKTITINILDAIDEQPSYFDTLVVYNLTDKKVVYFSDKEESKIQLELDKNDIYEYYGMDYNYRRKVLVEHDTFTVSHKNNFEFYVLKNICTLQVPYYFKSDSSEISKEMIEEIERMNEIISQEQEDENFICEVGVGLCLLRDSIQSEKSKARLEKIANMFDKKPSVRVSTRLESSYAEHFEEFCFIYIRIVQDELLKKVRILAKNYSQK